MLISMSAHNTCVLLVNAGSSSMKLTVFAVTPANQDPQRLLKLDVMGISQAETLIKVQSGNDAEYVEHRKISSHIEAVEVLLEKLTQAGLQGDIAAVGHRVVHGGPNFGQSQEITDELITYLESYADLDPGHAPTALKIIAELRRLLPHATHIACFDTAFFHDLPRTAQILPLPYAYQEQGVRRYGFHGLSYEYLDGAFRALAGDIAANGRVIYAHLGSGVSLTAMHHGKPQDTTMGFTPASGVPMSSRSGDLDPGVAWFLQQKHGIDAQAFNTMVNFESGLLGVSGLSADMYTLLQSQSTNTRAADAVKLFVYQVKKTIGAFSAALGGLNSLVFSGGMGEQSAEIRARICEDLSFLGIVLDPELNSHHATLISADASQVGVHVLSTNEAMTMYKHVTSIAKLN